MILTDNLELYLKETMSDWLNAENTEYFEYIYHDGITKFGIAGLKKYAPKLKCIQFHLMPFSRSTKVNTVYQLRLDYEIHEEALKEVDSETLEDHLGKLFLTRFLDQILEIAEIGIDSDKFKNGPFLEPEKKMYDV